MSKANYLANITMGALLAASFASSNTALAADLSLPTVAASSGDTVTASVVYRAQGAAVSALQFDLAHDDAAVQKNLTITGSSVGSAATAAGKDLASNLAFGQGVSRFLIFGLNQNVIGDGSLADLTIHVQDQFPPDRLRLHLFNVVCASPEAEFVPCGAADGQIIVTE